MYSQQFRCQPAGGTQPFDSALSFLKGLNVQELQDLMDDNDRLNKLVDTSDIVSLNKYLSAKFVAIKTCCIIVNLFLIFVCKKSEKKWLNLFSCMQFLYAT